MTYLENKKILFSLIDEKNPNSQFFTDDEDARIKCANLYDPRYFELASYRIDKKVKEYEVSEQGRGYEAFKLPSGTNIKILGGKNEYNERVSVDYYIEGEKIYISKENKVAVSIEYTPFPTHITDETSDDFTLEIDDELASILPYGVASDLFKTDPGEDWTSFEKEYQRRLQNVVSSRMGINVNITEGEF